jgi:prolipoprotein diacylglyceryl transferase
MNVLALIHWSVSPEILRLGPVSIRYYGLLFALGFIIGYQILFWIFNEEGKNQKDLEALTIAMIIGTVVGARLGHCLFYEPSYYLSNPIEILKVWKGGLASHGAGIGNLLAIYIFIKRRPHIKMTWIWDRAAITVALAAAFVRFGNFFNSEILGRASDVSWAIVFTRVDNVPRHPVQLYEAFSYIIIFVILILTYKKYKENLPQGLIAGMMLTFLFGARFIIEFFKEYQVPFESQLPIDMGQLLSLPFVALGIYLIIRSRKYKVHTINN